MATTFIEVWERAEQTGWDTSIVPLDSPRGRDSNP